MQKSIFILFKNFLPPSFLFVHVQHQVPIPVFFFLKKSIKNRGSTYLPVEQQLSANFPVMIALEKPVFL